MNINNTRGLRPSTIPVHKSLLVVLRLSAVMLCFLCSCTEAEVPQLPSLPDPKAPAPCAQVTPIVREEGLVPDDIELSPNGTELWVASTDRSAILRFDSASGAQIDPPWVENVAFPWALGLGPADSPALWFTETSAGRLHRFDTATRSDTVIAEGLTLPMDIAFDAKGRMLLCETKGVVLAFRDAWVSRIEGSPPDFNRKAVIVSGLKGACDIATLPNGDVYVVSGNSPDLLKIGERGETEKVPVDLSAPTDITYHPASGGLLVAQLNEVLWIDPRNGSYVKVACDGISHAEDLAVAPDGGVYLSESLGAEISLFNP